MAKFHILIVEDDFVIGLALCEELEALGASVVVKGDAESALAHLKDRAIDAAVIDVALPGMRGDLLAKECRRAFPQLPIVLATGTHVTELKTEIYGDPKLAVIEKPYEFSSLQECLDRLGVKLRAPGLEQILQPHAHDASDVERME